MFPALRRLVKYLDRSASVTLALGSSDSRNKYHRSWLLLDVRTRHLIRAILGIFLLVAMGPASLVWAAPPILPPQPATRPATNPVEMDRGKIRLLSRRALAAAKAGRLDDAEKALAEALVLDPVNSTNLYNMACVKALRGRSDAALDYLERSASEGFTDFIHIEKDTDLDSLRNLPRFKQFLAKKDEYQRKAADRVVAWLKHEFGDGYLYDIDEKNKLIFATNTDKETLVATKKWLVAQAQSQWADLFE